jgi:hypothetical protein
VSSDSLVGCLFVCIESVSSDSLVGCLFVLKGKREDVFVLKVMNIQLYLMGIVLKKTFIYLVVWVACIIWNFI